VHYTPEPVWGPPVWAPKRIFEEINGAGFYEQDTQPTTSKHRR